MPSGRRPLVTMLARVAALVNMAGLQSLAPPKERGRNIAMKRIVLVGVAAVMVSVLAASGVALAMTINCTAGALTCDGTKNSDTINGTTKTDNIFGRGGNDLMRGKGGADYMEGGPGADKVIGGPAGDPELWGGTLTSNGNYPDTSDDTVHGALG